MSHILIYPMRFMGLLLPILLSTVISTLAADVEIRHESIRLARIGPERRFGVSPTGILYRPADRIPQTAVIVIHPENDRRNDWHCSALARAGFAAFCMATRYVSQNEHLIMEEVVLDLAEAVRFLREDRGFRYVVLQGHSGGGSTVALYQNPAQKHPPHRLKHTPAGDPPDLNNYHLPPADGLIISAAHLGRGWAVARKLDPSVVDENDVLSVDPSLDMFDPENGFRIPPEPSRYSDDFVKRFKAGQARSNATSHCESPRNGSGAEDVRAVAEGARFREPSLEGSVENPAGSHHAALHDHLLRLLQSLLRRS